MIGEFELIRRFVSRLKKNPAVLVGPGDDAAVIRVGNRRLILTTDMLIEGVHFRRDWMTAGEIGKKSILVNFSDIAAMGGSPRFVLISVGLPRKTSSGFVDRLFRGMRRTVEGEGAVIVGGDTNASARLVIGVTVIGEAGGRLPTRRGARPGDFIYVTGTVGGAALGLEALRRRRKAGLGPFIRRHLIPPCRIGVGKELARNRHLHSLIDLSDGLVGDLNHILETSGVGAEVWLDRLPVSRGFEEGVKRLHLDPVRVMLAGGEDYELLFAVSPRVKVPDEIDGIQVTKIGKILPKGFGLRLIDAGGRLYPSRFTGFRHF